ncbi:hypothetical protein SteCoe_33181 [Stentor coeruleus]|uniref:Uncharacterized protein n=1 Tax=Stentor coeruleus TaxID=5963 RepID=A0A1R2AXB7_9CILI|nr:hypothetical protein SteCoe_33181 [Stentor coeruleus]
MENKPTYSSLKIVDEDLKSVNSQLSTLISQSYYKTNKVKTIKNDGPKIKSVLKKTLIDSEAQYSTNINKRILETTFQLPQIIKDIIPYEKMLRRESKIEINRKISMLVVKNSKSTSTLKKPSKCPQMPKIKQKLCNSYSESNSNKPLSSLKAKIKKKMLPLEYVKINISKKNSLLQSLKPIQVGKIMENLGNHNKNIKSINTCISPSHKISDFFNESVYNSTANVNKIQKHQGITELPPIDKEKNLTDYFNRVIREFDLEHVDCTEKEAVNIFDLYLPKDN